MKLFAVALMFLVGVILIVSLVYIITINRTKEKLALIEKGLNPKDFSDDLLRQNSIKWGMLLVGAGIGFILALVLDEYILTTIDNPAIYAGCIFTSSGLGLLLYYKLFK